MCDGKWNKYRAWCLHVGYAPNSFNINQVISYGAVLRNCERNSTDTIRGKFAAIMNRWLNLGYDGPPITSFRAVKKFLRGTLRRQGGQLWMYVRLVHRLDSTECFCVYQ